MFYTLMLSSTELRAESMGGFQTITVAVSGRSWVGRPELGVGVVSEVKL